MKDGCNTMNDNENVIENNTTSSAEDYIRAIEDLRNSTVSKEDFDRERAEKKRLLESLTRGEYLTDATPGKEKKSVEELRKALANPDQTNLEYWTTAITLRETLMEEGKPDPFTPVGYQIQASETDKAEAQRVADGISWCIEKSEGNAALFNSYLQQITVEPPEIRLMRSKKK